MCRVLGVHFSGFYAWLKSRLGVQAKRQRYLTGLIKQSWLESGCVYGYRKVHHDLLSLGENCAENTVAKLMRTDQIWVTDITYICTHEGWLYLAVVIDLYARKVVGWSMQSRMHTPFVLNALLMAVWRRKPSDKVTIHSDQGSQYTSQEWRDFQQDHNLGASMSRRDNCYE